MGVPLGTPKSEAGIRSVHLFLWVAHLKGKPLDLARGDFDHVGARVHFGGLGRKQGAKSVGDLDGRRKRFW